MDADSGRSSPPATHAEPATTTEPTATAEPTGTGPSRKRSSGRRATSMLVVLLVLLGIGGSARVLWVAAVGVGPQVREQQLGYLERALDHGAAEDMQAVFPEGFVFSHALIGLAAAQPAPPGDEKALVAARRALAALDSPAGTARFAGQSRPVNGVFWAGWSLLLAVEVARLSGEPDDQERVRARALPIRDALAADADGFLESYPGKAWPVDNMVAVAALARADALVGVPRAGVLVDGWPARIAARRDRPTGLLPHQLNADGSVEGPRGSSQALLLAFEPDVSRELAARDYRQFVDTFVVRQLGLVGVREFPVNVPGAADTDSGPLLLGVSASASAVALAAAARQGDQKLVAGLNAEAELLGAPVTWNHQRRYGLGRLPIGDAFLVWARSQPPTTERTTGTDGTSAAATGSSDSPEPFWPLWVLLPLLPGAFALGLLLTVQARERRSTAFPRAA